MDLSGHGHGHGHGREGVEMAIPITSSYMGHQAHSQGIMNGPHPPPPPPSTSITEEQQQQQQQQQHHQQNQNQNQNQKKGSTWVKYKECLKNHAASIGGNATDGCGEFMPSGEEGTIEALKCSACNCHRNFHRKESEGPETYSLIPRSAGAHMVMPLGSFQTSESDEMDRHQHQHQHQAPLMRKRFRTKFTPEQKEKMLEFAESVGWRLQKQEETVVQHFCQEIGVKRRVLKVWMHNNKHNLAKSKNVVDHPPPSALQLDQ